jgi:hypothetical protein
VIVTTAALFKIAYGEFAVGAYNINNMEQTLGLFRGNLESQAPFIIQISRGARSYADKRMLEAMIGRRQIFPSLSSPFTWITAIWRLRFSTASSGFFLGHDRCIKRVARETSASPGRWWRLLTLEASLWRRSSASWAG